jgi:hypothetical protein
MATPDETKLTLERFSQLPKRYRDHTVDIVIETNRFRSADAQTCEAIGLPTGETVADHVNINGCGNWWLYASGDIAEKIIAVPKAARLRVTAKTRYGVKTDTEWTNEGSITKYHDLLVLVIENFEAVENDTHT